MNLVLSGGLGNQLFSLCAGYSVAKIQKRGLVVWVPASISTKYFGSMWDELDFNFFQDELPVFRQFSDLKLLGKLKLKYFRLIAATNKNNPHFREKLVEGNINWISENRSPVLAGHFECQEIPELAHKLGFPRNLNLHKESKNYLELLRRLRSENPIAVHVRLGDYVNWQSGKHLLGKSYYLNALNHFPNYDESRCLWIFSDDISGAREIFRDFSNVLYIDQSFGLTGAEEMILMSKTNGLIASKSTFSWWSGCLSDFQTAVVSPHSGWRKKAWITQE